MKLNIQTNFVLVLFCCLLIASSFSFSQEFEKLSVKDGLSNHVVFSIKQYNKGLMWFSTKQGIDKYDGAAFKHYNLYPDSEIFQFGQRHSKLHTDRFGRFWAINNIDIFLYDKKVDLFQSVYSKKEALIWDFSVIDSLNFLLATNKGLLKYNFKTHEVQHYPELKNKVNKFFEYDKDLILLAEKDKIITFDRTKGRIGPNILKPSHLKALNNEPINALYVDKFKNIYLGSIGTVISFNLKNSSIKSSDNLNKVLNNYKVRVIVSDENNIYIGTDGIGVFKADTGLRVLDSFISDQNNPYTINDNLINDIFIDNNKRIWIGGMGISYYDPNKLRFNFHEHHTNDPNSLVNNYVRAATEDDDGNLWIGTRYGISIYNRKRQSWKHVTLKSMVGISATGDILSLAKDSNGNILIGTYKHGLYIVDKNHKAKKIPGSNNHSIYNISTSGNQIWAGVEDAALLFKNDKVISFPMLYALSTVKTKEGNIITGGHTGLNIITPQGKITTYNHLKYKIGSIFSVKIDSKGRIWCASEGQGLIRFDDKRKIFLKYTVKNGLPSNIVYSILEDKKGNLWLSTTNGLSCFNPEKETFKNYSISDGLKIKEFNYGAAAITSKGELVFGGINGFVIFKPEEISSINVNTSLVFKDFKIFNISSKIDQKNSPLEKVIDETDTIYLKHNQNSISFDFTSINLTNISKTRYSWMLEGFEKTWSPVGTAQTASYTNLKPGKYLFKIRSTNNSPNFFEAERSITVIISSPFWRTPWAYFLYLLIIIAIVYIIIRFYRVQLSEERAKDKINLFINIAHDIRTPLSLIRSPLSLAIKNNDSSARTLKSLKTADQNAERLSELINQLLEFEKAENKKAELKLQPINAEDVLHMLCANFDPLLKDKKITLIKNFKQLNTNILVDRDKFDKIIFNLLSNAIKYTPENGEIEIITNIFSGKYLIQISDTGLGIPLKQQKHIFQRHFRAENALISNEPGNGIGLMLTQKLVEQHNGLINFESIEGKGSTFKVMLPLVQTPSDTTEETEPRYSAISTFKEQDELSQKSNTNTATLLIADDHQELRKHLVENLSEFYTIYEAADGKEALELTRKVYPDIILSDVMMPKMNGNQFCYEVKNHIETSHIPFILLTSLTDTQFKIDGIKIGADIYLEKPFNLELIKTCIDNLLNSRKRLKDKFLKGELPDNEELSELDKVFLETIIRIIESNLSNSKFSIEDFEKEIGMSHSALYRKFKSVINKTPLEFINQYRLKKAAELLQQGKHNVNEVAYLVGFSDPKYFGTLFKKLFGKNASDYKTKL